MTKRIVIPAILAATILVAGMFAFMPVEKAATVHTSVGTIKAKSATGAAFTSVAGNTQGLKADVTCITGLCFTQTAPSSGGTIATVGGSMASGTFRTISGFGLNINGTSVATWVAAPTQ